MTETQQTCPITYFIFIICNKMRRRALVIALLLLPIAFIRSQTVKPAQTEVQPDTTHLRFYCEKIDAFYHSNPA